MTKIIENSNFSNNIDIQNYTASLLASCAENKSISMNKLQHIQQELDLAFVETAEQYTKRQSSTIPKAVAKQLYSSLLYQSDMALLSLKSHDKAISFLNDKDMNEILDLGRKIIFKLHEESKEIFRLAYKYRLKIPVYVYRYAMDIAFDEYCSKYSARFNALDLCTSIDYPLLGENAYDFKEKGVLFIHEYYSRILLENMICERVGEIKVTDFIKVYAKKIKSSVESLFVNFTEILLDNIFANLLLKSESVSIELSQQQIKELQKRYKDFDEKSVVDRLKICSATLDFTFENPKITRYIRTYYTPFSIRFITASANSNLKNYLTEYIIN